jgi:hypothetical protein
LDDQKLPINMGNHLKTTTTREPFPTCFFCLCTSSMLKSLYIYIICLFFFFSFFLFIILYHLSYTLLWCGPTSATIMKFPLELCFATIVPIGPSFSKHRFQSIFPFWSLKFSLILDWKLIFILTCGNSFSPKMQS